MGTDVVFVSALFKPQPQIRILKVGRSVCPVKAVHPFKDLLSHDDARRRTEIHFTEKGVPGMIGVFAPAQRQHFTVFANQIAAFLEFAVFQIDQLGADHTRF